MIHSKKTNEGFLERLETLAKFLPEVNKIINDTLVRFKRKEVKPDDILDSMVAAITASFRKNRLVALPEDSETDSTGLPMEIVYPEI